MSAEPISQATRSMATTLTRAPPVASSARAGDQVMWRRSLPPRWVVRAWPIEAQMMITTTAMTTTVDEACLPLSVTRSQISGSRDTAMRPPPRKPITDRMPTTKPWR